MREHLFSTVLDTPSLRASSSARPRGSAASCCGAARMGQAESLPQRHPTRNAWGIEYQPETLAQPERKLGLGVPRPLPRPAERPRRGRMALPTRRCQLEGLWAHDAHCQLGVASWHFASSGAADKEGNSVLPPKFNFLHALNAAWRGQLDVAS